MIVRMATATLAVLAATGASADPLPKNYYQHLVTANCNTGQVCTMVFPRVSSPAALKVNTIDCYLYYAGSGAAPAALSAGAVESGIGDYSVPLLSTTTLQSPGGRNTLVHHDGDFYLPPGTRPGVSVLANASTNGISGYCSIAGLLVRP